MDTNSNYYQFNEDDVIYIENSTEPNTDDNTIDHNSTFGLENLYIQTDDNNGPQIQAENFEYFDDMVNPHVLYDGTVYACTLCTENSSNFICIESRDIIKHLWEIHREKIYVCNICNEQFHYNFELSKHIKIHVSINSGKKWQCEKCPKKFASQNLLTEHENIHTGARPFVCHCGKAYASKYTFKTHQKTHGPRERSYTCYMCPNSFLSKQNLKQHEETHNQARVFSCNLCDNKTYATENNLKSHMIVHEGDKKFLCPYILGGQPCGKKFSRKAELQDHERIHTGARPFPCLECNMTFTQRSNLQSHTKATHLNIKNKLCPYCKKGFKRTRLVQYHIDAKHLCVRRYKCTECDKAFVYPEHLKKHKLLHQNIKPFVCVICAKNFSSRDNYNSHLYSHADKMQYECVTCGAGFKRKPALKKHIAAEEHDGSTFVLNRIHLHRDITSNTPENIFKLRTYPETKEMNERTNSNSQNIPADDTVYEEYADQYFSNIQNENYQNVLTDNNNQILQNNNYGNDYPQFSLEGHTNEHDNEITNQMPANYNPSNLVQQIILDENNQEQYVIYEMVMGTNNNLIQFNTI